MVPEETAKEKVAQTPIIVIVDDDLSDLEKFQRALKDIATVYTSTSGIEAFQLIKSLPEIQVLIVNNELPRMKGTELFRFLQEMDRKSESIIKILLTDLPNPNLILDSPSIGRIDYTFTKPVDPEDVRRKVSYFLAQKSREKRSSMRVRLNHSSDIKITTGHEENVRVVNMSENGMFLTNMSSFPEGSTLPLRIMLPDGKQYAITARIVRQDTESSGVGVEFLSMDEQSRKWLLQFLSDYITVRDLSGLKERYPFLRTDEMVLFSDSLKIESLMYDALNAQTEVVAIHAQSRNPEILRLANLSPPSACILAGEHLNIKFKTSDILFLSFQIGYATYNFETMVSRIEPDGKKLICLYPRVMFYSEKRAARRISPYGNLSLEIALPPPFKRIIKGKITDISPEGTSFIANSDSPCLLAGTPLESVRILEGNKLLWEEKGEVRNVSRVGRGDDGRLRYGVQFGIGRMSIQSTRAPEFEFRPSDEDTPDTKKARYRPAKTVEPSEPVHKPPEVIRLENQHGEEIVGLLNSSFPLNEKPVPVVLIPPAFGKTKETLFGLALTIIENFHLLGKPVAVIRYDGIRRKGESHKDPEASEPPYEMIKANLSQGADDIKAVLDWLQLNARLKASSVILISFSLSALEARIVLRDEVCRRRINYWISCMGTLEFRNLMNRVNCGLDLLEQYQLGIDLGVIPILGNLINMVPYAADVVASSVATLDQAREDMRHIDLPITWIYGKYDNWVKPEFIRDVMSIHANALREVISVPIGHNARTSEEALQLFGLTTSLIHRFLYKEMIHPTLPNKQDMEVMRRAEKDRLPPRQLKNRKGYWQRYLVGEDNLMGFDIMALSDDYNQLMHDQMLALNLTSEDRLLDLGSGTGNFVEHLLQSGQPLPTQITIADLIPAGLKQAYQKLSVRSNALKKPGQFNLLCLDLEFNRFLPVQRFLAGEIGSFVELADKIESLDLESAEKIQKAYSPRLHRLLRGEIITPAINDWLKTQFELPEYRVILDFNQAARYVRRLTVERPSFRKLVFPGPREGNLHLPVNPGWYNKILMSLVLSYIFNPVETLFEVRRIIRPGGRLVLSSMRPDTDASGLFTRLMEKIEATPPEALPPEWPKPLLLESLRSFLNDAQALVDLEEAGTFDFFDPEKLERLLEDSGWEIIRTIPTFGDPPQGYVVVAEVRKTNG